MKSLIELFAIIDLLVPEELDQHALKIVLLAEDNDQLEKRFVTRHEIELLRKEMTIRFGVMVAAGVTVLATLMKLL